MSIDAVSVSESHLNRGTNRGLVGMVLLVLAVLLELVGTGPAAFADPAGSLGVDMVVNSNGVESRDVVVKGGATKLFIIKYSCSSSDCTNVTIDLPLDANVSFSGEQYGSDWTQTRTSQAVSWHADSLSAGTTSQITFNLSVADGVLPDGTVITHQAEISGDGNSPLDSDPVNLTVRSAGSTRAEIQKLAGGAVDAWTTYAVRSCLAGPSDPDFGQLGVQSGSELTMTIPEGAVVKDSDGATTNGRDLTWTFGAIAGAGCQNRTVKLDYPSSDSANTVGADTSIPVSWSGAMQGGAQQTLGMDTLTATLAAQSSDSGEGMSSWLNPHDVYTGDNVSQTYHAANTGTGVLDSVRVDTDLSTGQKATNIWAQASRSAGQLWISVDGGPLTKIADVNAMDSVSIDPYAATLPNGQPGLTSGHYVTAVRFLTGGLQPGDGLNVLSIVSEVLATTTDGTEVHVGDRFDVAGQFVVDDSIGGASHVKDADHEYVIAQRPIPKPNFTVRAGGGNSVANGGSTTVGWSASVGGAQAVDPVMTMRLDKQLTVNSWSVSSNQAGLPAPTMTKLVDATPSHQTLVRFTWPSGTVWPVNTGYGIDLNVTYGEKAYGNAQYKGFASSATQDYDCGDPWFLEGPDTGDYDGNGNTTKTLCAWGGQVVPTPLVGAQLVQSIKGAWDSSFKAGPATSYSSPGNADMLRAELQNAGNVFLKNATVVTKLPRPGDARILSSAQRNPTSRTFPMVLSGKPTVPTLDDPVTILWTNEANPCLPEVGASAAGCSTPTWTDWSTTAPTTVTDVTALKFDYGSNQLEPFGSWTADIPVTTPTSGATEPDFAVSNPDETDTANDERAVATSAAVASRADISSQLNPIESTPVTLAMPGTAGPYNPPAPEDLTSNGAYPAPQGVTVSTPVGGTVQLLDGSQQNVASNELIVPGQGTYVLNPSTGRITFTPAAGFTGSATPISYRVVDQYGEHGDATYTPEVQVPDAPAPADKTSQGIGTTPQSVSFTKPSGGSVQLVDPQTHAPIATDEVVIPHVGTYRLDPGTGTITFTPVLGYLGTPDSVSVAVTDGVGQHGYATYLPTVQAPAAPETPSKSVTSAGGQPGAVSVTVPTGGTLRLWNGTDAVTSIGVTGQGVYTVDQTANLLVFTPDRGFTGDPTPVSYQVTDAYGQSSRGVFSPHVASAAHPTPGQASPTNAQGRRGESVVLSPLSHVTAPQGGTIQADTLRVARSLNSHAEKSVHTKAGTWTVLSQGRVVFHPERRFVGVATAAFAVRTSDGHRLRSTLSVVVRGVVEGHRSATVYFKVRSAHVSHHYRVVLRRLARTVPKRATTRALSVGYVQPEHYRGNDRRLSRARAEHVAQELSTMMHLSHTKISGKGRAHQHNWRARRATVTVHWKLIQH